MNKKILSSAFFMIVLFSFIGITSAAQYIVGYVNDAKDTTSANGRIAVLWNPINGIIDNVTDIIGETGNSGRSPAGSAY